MNIYLLTQDVNNGYDTYDSVVVAAKSPEDAREIHPSKFCTHVSKGEWMGTYSKMCRDESSRGKEYVFEDWSWVDFDCRDKINVVLIGEARSSIERGVVCSSFNAG